MLGREGRLAPSRKTPTRPGSDPSAKKNKKNPRPSGTGREGTGTFSARFCCVNYTQNRTPAVPPPPPQASSRASARPPGAEGSGAGGTGRPAQGGGKVCVEEKNREREGGERNEERKGETGIGKSVWRREGRRENQARRGAGPGRTCMVTTPSSSVASFLIWVAKTCASSRIENSASAALNPQTNARQRRPNVPRPRWRRPRESTAASRLPPPRAMLPPRPENRGHRLRSTSTHPPPPATPAPPSPEPRGPVKAAGVAAIQGGGGDGGGLGGRCAPRPALRDSGTARPPPLTD